jgi:hypothetical protein
MPSGDNLRSVKALVWSGRILASAATVLFMWALTFFSFGGNTSSIEVGFAGYFIVLLMMLASPLLSWRKDRIAAGLLVFNSLVILIMLDYAASFSFNMWLIIGLPFLVAGILLVAAWALTAGVSGGTSYPLKTAMKDTT